MTAPACGSCGAPVDGARLCTSCTRDLAEQLLIAASISGDLDDAVAKLLRRGSGGPRSEIEAPLPIDLTAADARRSLSGCLMTWVLRMQPAPGTVLLGIPAMARWLCARLGIIRQYRDAPQLLDSMRSGVGYALAVIDRKPERAPAGNCGSCGAQLLAELGADEVTCQCGILTIALQDKRRDRAAAADVLGTAAEISGAMAKLGISIPRGTITSWASRGRLTARTPGVYALSDVLALHAQSQSRAGR
jgi:hypothetical protein